MATTRSPPVEGADPAREPEARTTLPVRVRGGVHHYRRVVDCDAVDPGRYAEDPGSESTFERAYLVEVHRVDHRVNGRLETDWWLVYADPTGRPAALPPHHPLANSPSGIRHAIACSDARLRDGAGVVHSGVRDRLAELVVDRHAVANEVSVA